jgi:HrpA-like RNA helicase
MTFQIRPDGIMDPFGKYLNPLTGTPYTPQYYFHANKLKDNGKLDGWTKFKPWVDRLEILRKIHNNNIVLIKIPPGTGKTVIIPKLLLHYFGYQKKVICTTPRQATTSSAGEYSAACLDVPLYQIDEKGEYYKNLEIKGKQENRYDTGLRIVGYRHGAKNMSNNDTLLLFTTDGTVKQMLLQGSDPNLSQYGGVVVDEVHERSVNIDVVIALLLDIVKRRPDFKVIFMSATIDENQFVDYFKKIGLGKTYSIYMLDAPELPYKRIIKPELKRINQSTFMDIIFQKINSILKNPKTIKGDILAFVTSESETQKMVKRINNNLKEYPLDGKPYAIAYSKKISDIEANIATKKNTLQSINPTADAPNGFSRKVIIATNVVESSVTFEDPITFVIESGLAFEKIYDAKNYCYKTGKFYVSQASIEQRCGRTGRTCDGECIQLYTSDQFKNLKQFTDPKILLEDFTTELLNIICLPMNRTLQKGLEFLSRMIQEPKTYQPTLIRAYKNLLNMDLIDSTGNITPLGDICSNFNKFDIKIGKMCIAGYYLGCMEYVMMLGSILREVLSYEDIFIKPLGADEDPVLEKQYQDKIKKISNPLGDHITLLQIYYLWSISSDRRGFSNNYGLDNKKLENIESAYKELIRTVEKLMPQIVNLNLFELPPQMAQYGGSNIAKSTEDNHNNIPSGGNMWYDDSSDDSDTGDILGDNISKDYELMLGGFDGLFNNNKPNIKLETDNNAGKSNGKSNKKFFQNNNTNFDVLYRNSKFSGGYNTIPIKRIGIKTKKSQASGNIYNSKNNARTRSKEYTNIGGGEHNKALENEQRAKRYEKIMNLISLEGLKSKVIPAFIGYQDELYDRIIMALFYGFSNNMASYTGNGDKYNVKFSNLKASISGSSFEFLNKTPNLIIYHEFTNMITPGKEDSKLSLITEITALHIGMFLDVNEIIKKI